MTPDDIANLFTDKNGSFHFARWSLPISPMVFGDGAIDLETMRTGFAQVSALSGMRLAEKGQEGVFNCAFWFVKDWRDLLDLPGLGAALGTAADTIKKLQEGNFLQRRSYQYDKVTGGLTGVTTLLCMQGKLAAMEPAELALRQAVMASLRWSIRGLIKEGRPERTSPYDITPDQRAILSVAYAPNLPDASRDRTFAWDLAKRISAAAAA